MPMYNLRQLFENIWGFMGILKDESNLDDNGIINNFPNDTDSALFQFKQNINGLTGNNGTKMLK